MTPPQIIAQFRKVLESIRADEQLSDAVRQQQIQGAYTMAAQLIRAHPKLFAKDSTRPYMAELKAVLGAP